MLSWKSTLVNEDMGSGYEGSRWWFEDECVGGKKVSFLTNEIYIGLGGLNRNSTMGLMHGPKAISEDPRSPLYFMPWVRVGLTRVAHKQSLQRTRQHS